MLNMGKCKCGKALVVNNSSYDCDNFEGHIVCKECGRLYYMEIKRNKARLGRCLRFLKIYYDESKMTITQCYNVNLNDNEKLLLRG